MEGDKKTTQPEEQSDARIAEQTVSEGNGVSARCDQEHSPAGSEASGSEHETLVQDIQVRAPQEAVTPPEIAELASSQRLPQRKEPKRRDAGHFHAMRHGLLSRHTLTLLCRLGENPKTLRRLERRLREALKPEGVVAELLFDKFWNYHLRCLLAVRFETMILANLTPPTDRTTRVTSLIERETPTLVYSEVQDHCSSADLFASPLENLCLIQRYEAHFRKEEFRALALLLVSAGNSKDGLAQCIRQMLGINRDV